MLFSRMLILHKNAILFRIKGLKDIKGTLQPIILKKHLSHLRGTKHVLTEMLYVKNTAYCAIILSFSTLDIRTCILHHITILHESFVAMLGKLLCFWALFQIDTLHLLERHF